MTRARSKLIATSLAALMLGTALPAAAQTPPETQGQPVNSWASQPIRMTYTGEGHSDRRKAKIDHGEILYTTSTAQPGLYLRCLEGRLRAGLVFKPQDMRKAFSGLSVSGVSGGGGFVPIEKQLAYVDMWTDGGEKIGLGRWTYSKKNSAAISRKRVPAAKLYNAVVKGQNIKVKSKGLDAVTLSIPKINSDFANFGGECGMGRNK